MPFASPPSFAAWRHRDARNGFEVVFLQECPHGCRFEGATSAVEDGEAWAVEYTIEVDATWVTRSAHVVGRSRAGRADVRLEVDEAGEWLVDGVSAPFLRGCRDIDLESSSFTNALPVQRLSLEIGQAVEAPAVYVRALDLTVERLEQRYARITDERSLQRYEYSAPRFEYAGRLAYDATGLLLDYPGIAERVA
jgi:uncharacterized protein